MVLLNGVKYACERCIRGHRVSSCTHTDKPLTMIKPKGRPASQCPHCREQRKLKNTHSSCSCGKKGKSPGQHLASCLCHKNSHCTCPTKEKKPKKDKEKDKDKKPRADFDHDAFGEERNLEPSGSALSSNYLIEDVMVPFDTDLGLLEYFAHDDAPYADAKDVPFVEKPLHPQQLQGLHQFPKPPSDADLDVVENMFPLFPLVGTCLFDDSKSLPLLPLPDRQFASTRMNNSTSSFSTFPGSASVGSLIVGATDAVVPTFTPHTHHPRPLKPSASMVGAVGVGAAPAARPRRPESVLSVASTSSNTSKNNIFETGAPAHHTLPKLASSGAFPPFQMLENNSSDDLPRGFCEPSGIFNDAQLLSILSDYDDMSRQPLQLRRKTSLTRSHSQLHHIHNGPNKDHPLVPIKPGLLSESSPPQSLGVFSPIDQLSHFRQNGELHLREVREEDAAVRAHGEAGVPLDGVPVSTYAEYLEIAAVPMFQEFVNSLKHDF